MASATRPGRTRRALSWLPALALVPAAMASSMAVSTPDDPTGPMRAVFPLDLGTTWVYAVTNNGEPSGTRTRQITGKAAIDEQLLDAVTFESRYTDYPEIGAYTSISYLGLDGDRLNEHAIYSGHQQQVVDPPAPAYELPVEEGHSWSYSGALDETPYRTETRLADIGEVTVGGRTFEDCAHYVTDFRITLGEEDATETVEEWTCPGYGPVRTRDRAPSRDVDIVEELVEFHGEAGNWWAETPSPAPPADAPSPVDGEIDDALAWSDVRAVAVAFAPVGDERIRVLAETDGSVSGTDPATGEVRWRLRLAGPIVAPPALAGDVVLVADADKKVWAFDVLDGRARWVRTLDDVASAAPRPSERLAVVATEDREVTALDLTTGTTVWRTALGAPAAGAPALTGDRAVVADRSGTVTGLDLADGDQVWHRSLDGAVEAPPVAAGELVLAADDRNVLYAWDADDGALEWEAVTEHAPAGELAVGADTLVLPTTGDRLEAYALADGDHRWSVPTDAAPRTPVVVGDQVVGVSEAGRVEVRDVADGSLDTSWRLPVTRGSTIEVDVPVAFLGDTVVFGGEVSTDGSATAFFAYPTSAAAARPGVALASELRVVPTPPSAPPTMVGQTLLFPGQDHSLWASTGTTELARLLAGKGLLPGVATDGDLAISQRGRTWQAVDIASGEPAWEFPASDPLVGSIPAIDGDTAFLPVHGAGLAAVDAADGSPRWYRPLPDDIGGTTPLVLPDGDVVYASGELVRYDRATGEPRWSVPDLALYSTPTLDDGVVLVDAIRDEHPSGLSAYDAETGKRLWFHENPNWLVVASPAAAGGVVVYADELGLVTALDVHTGEVLWDLQLRTTTAGTPVIHDGRAYVVEAGHDNDLFQRDYQVTVHDLRSGALLASFEPAASGYENAPAIGHGPDGELLVPATTDLGSVVQVLKERS